MKNPKMLFGIGLLLGTVNTIIYSAAAAEPDEKRYSVTRADINALNDYGLTALMLATCDNQSKKAYLLLQKKADANTRNHDGGTALIYAAFNDRPEMVGLLLQNKADADAQEVHGLTALMGMAFSDRTQMASLLLQKKAHINAHDCDGETALVYAAESSNSSSETLKLLLRSGADFTIPGTQGKRTIREMLTEEFKSEKRVVFDQHISYLELLMGRYNEAVIKNEIKDKKRIEDLTSAQHHVTKMEKELFELELSPLFNELSLVANKTGRDSLFQHFKE